MSKGKLHKMAAANTVMRTRSGASQISPTVVSAGSIQTRKLRLPGETWYVKSITASGPASVRQAVDIGRGGLALKSGEWAKGLTVTLTEGAASERGRIIPATADAKLPASR